MLKMRVKLQEWALGRESAPWTWRGDFVTKQAVREKLRRDLDRRGKGEGGEGKEPK